MKTLSVVLAGGLVLMLSVGTAVSSEYERYGGKDYERHERFESKIYGTVERIPKEFTGTWVVSGKEVYVSLTTNPIFLYFILQCPQ